MTATREGVVPQGEKRSTRQPALNAKHLRFVDEYIVDLNATQAAIRAGYSPKTAKQQGHRLLTYVDVQRAIEAKRKEVAGDLGITRERVLREMAKLAFSDLRQLYNEDGSLKHPHEWPEGAAGAISGMELVEEFGDGPDGKKLIGYTKKLKLWDKGKQLENLLKHLGMDQDKPADVAVDLSDIDRLRARLAERQQKS